MSLASVPKHHIPRQSTAHSLSLWLGLRALPCAVLVARPGSAQARAGS